MAFGSVTSGTWTVLIRTAAASAALVSRLLSPTGAVAARLSAVAASPLASACRYAATASDGFWAAGAGTLGWVDSLGGATEVDGPGVGVDVVPVRCMA